MTHPTHDFDRPDDGAPDDDPPDDVLRDLIARADERPTLRPSRDLWPAIAARLDAAWLDAAPPASPAAAEARVLAFRPPPAPRTTRFARAPWLAAAAAAVAIVSSGATYLVVRQPAGEPRVVAVRPIDAHRESVSESSPPSTREPIGTPRATEPTAAPPHTHADAGAVARSVDRADAQWAAQSVDRTVPGAVDYDREIADLRAALTDRRGDLDSATVDVLARNLRIIDAAITASRAALARDPHSPFLGEQLTRALGQKVELLRTAAFLPHT
ncbi:MAG TPA: hypothetical protein VGD56_05170 [Gemmatirosa sp.]